MNFTQTLMPEIPTSASLACIAETPAKIGPSHSIDAEAALVRAHAEGGSFAVAYLGVDDLKSIIDLWGEQTGHQVVAVLVSRLRRLRFEGAKFFVDRLGVDDLIVYGTLPADTSDWIKRFNRVLSDVVGATMVINGRRRRVLVSIGVAVSSLQSTMPTMSSMLVEARSALVLGHQHRRGPVVVVDRNEPNTADLIRGLPRALEDGQVWCHYQPTVDVVTGEILHVEALARWTKPCGQSVSPSVFVPIVEAYGLAGELTATVLRCVYDFIAAPTTPQEVRVWVNVSPYELETGDFATRFLKTLSWVGIEPHQIGVELTESAAVRDPARLSREFKALQRRGVLVAIDDFGSGYSPLGHLAELSADLVKLDRSLIADIDTDIGRQQMVAGLVAMLRQMGTAITAEGVERPQEQAWLLEHDVRDVQGFLWGKPCEPASFDWSRRDPLRPRVVPPLAVRHLTAPLYVERQEGARA